jgi:hypothetical protein
MQCHFDRKKKWGKKLRQRKKSLSLAALNTQSGNESDPQICSDQPSSEFSNVTFDEPEVMSTVLVAENFFRQSNFAVSRFLCLVVSGGEILINEEKVTPH